MDPQAIYDAWLAADEASERRELRESYNAWRERGGFAAVDADGAAVDRIGPDPAYGQDEARGILAVNPYEEGTGEWHAWGFGYGHAVATQGAYDAPLSGEWAGMVSLSELCRRIGTALGLELDDDDTEWVAEAFEHGYEAWQAGWRV
jgi:hypothetical protein